jgi:NitT/TauT family transport system ATP-binding protein
MPEILIEAVSKTFSGKAPVHALADLSLTIGRGEFVTLLGPSGCGKSTLLRMVNGVESVSTGTISIFGVPPDQARRQKQFGLVPQSPALMPWRTVRRNVNLLNEVNRSAAQHDPLPPARVDELLHAVGLEAFLDSYPATLSGGMQQRVSLVRAFASGAPVLLMDEPFAALDEITRAEMRYLLLDLWAGCGTTVLFVTHSIDEAVILSDRVAVMASRPGRIVAEEAITLPRPRHEDVEDSEAFHHHVTTLRAALRGSWVR